MVTTTSAPRAQSTAEVAAMALGSEAMRRTASGATS
jgi:hypothetical protein